MFLENKYKTLKEHFICPFLVTFFVADADWSNTALSWKDWLKKMVIFI